MKSEQTRCFVLPIARLGDRETDKRNCQLLFTGTWEMKRKNDGKWKAGRDGKIHLIHFTGTSSSRAWSVVRSNSQRRSLFCFWRVVVVFSVSTDGMYDSFSSHVISTFSTPQLEKFVSQSCPLLGEYSHATLTNDEYRGSRYSFCLFVGGVVMHVNDPCWEIQRNEYVP